MDANPALAHWLVGQRNTIEGRLAARLGPAAPRASGPEAETLRRFRTFATTALMRGQAPPPALEGLRPDERRVMSLLTNWKEAAADLAGPEGQELALALEPLLAQFRLALRTSSGGQRQRARTHAPRRAVTGAIDRVADAFLAIDVSGGTIVDANPAAGALLGVDRDSLFGLDLMGFVPPPHRDAWWAQLDAVAESDESLAFEAFLENAGGECFRSDARAAAFNARGRTLALVMLRPDSAYFAQAGLSEKDVGEDERAPRPATIPLTPESR